MQKVTGAAGGQYETRIIQQEDRERANRKQRGRTEN
jgi:hypothetical protein